VIGTASAAVLIGSGGAVAAVVGLDPLDGDSLPKPIAPAQNAPGTRASLAVDLGDGRRWTNVVYRGATGGLCLTLRRSEAPSDDPTGGCASGFVVGVNFLQDGPAIVAAVMDTADGKRRVLVYGFVDSGASQPVVRLGDAELHPTIGTDAVRVPVDRNAPGLTAEGHQVAEKLPDHIEVRPFVAVFDNSTLAPEVSMSLNDAGGRPWKITQRVG
jgi:hypothetical protein